MSRPNSLIQIIAACVLLVGCSIPTTGVVQLSDGLNKVTRQGNGFWVTTASLKTEAVAEANAGCAPRRARVIDVKETQAKPMGGWPEAEVLFKCE